MVFTLYTLLEASLLVVNGIAILNRDRFLSKVGLANADNEFGQQSSVRAQIVNLIAAVQTVMRVPLIFVNIVVIFLKLLVG